MCQVACKTACAGGRLFVIGDTTQLPRIHASEVLRTASQRGTTAPIPGDLRSGPVRGRRPLLLTSTIGCFCNVYDRLGLGFIVPLYSVTPILWVALAGRRNRSSNSREPFRRPASAAAEGGRHRDPFGNGEVFPRLGGTSLSTRLCLTHKIHSCLVVGNQAFLDRLTPLRLCDFA